MSGPLRAAFVVALLAAIAFVVRTATDSPAREADRGVATAARGSAGAFASGPVVFDGTHKSSWDEVIEAGPGRIADTPDPLGSGASVMRFTVRDSDVAPLTPTRNPRAQLQTPNFIRPGDELWISGRILIPTRFPDLPPGGWITVLSVYGPPYHGTSPAPLQILRTGRDRQARFGIVSRDWRTRYWGVPVSRMRGHWVRWRIHERFAVRGWMEAWVNGRKVMARRNLPLIDHANDRGRNHVANGFYRERGMFATATLYQAGLRVRRVG